ncbi:hypothetical protein [Roseateles sp. PN1]|uniref:hypothetical protein n=1 Tax=Roseateles sp. PN1 TaxID=3137372 RepID=UPI00313A35A7
MTKKIVLMALSGALFSFSAQAANNLSVQSGNAGGRVVLVPTVSSNGTPYIKPTWVTNGPSSGAVVLNDLIKAGGPAGRSLDLSAVRALPWGTIAKTAAKATGYAGLAVTVFDIWSGLRTKPNASGDGWLFDPGVDPGNVSGYVCSPGNGITGQGTTSYQACSAAMAQYNKKFSTYSESGSSTYGCTNTISFQLGPGGPAQGQFAIMQTNTVGYRGDAGSNWCGSTAVSKIGSVTALPIVITSCADTPDGKPVAIGFDGKCPSGKSEPISTETAADLFEQNAPKDQARNIAEELLKRDIEFSPAPDIKIDGEKKIESEPKVKTETAPDGSTKTTTTKDVYNITYNGNSYNWNVSTVTVNSDGSTSTETKPDEQATPPNDLSMPERPKLYKQKYPDGVQGVWDKEMGAIKSTPIFSFLNSLNPNIGGAACPRWTFPTGRVLGIDVGGDLSVPCSVWFALKAIMIVSALLLARRLVFGG